MKKALRVLNIGLMAFGLMFTQSCDKCKDVECKNTGTCDKGVCTCPPNAEGEFCETCKTGYEGDGCGTKIQDKFLGSWKGTGSCNVTETFSVTASSDLTKILIKTSSFWFDCDGNGVEEVPIETSATIGADGKSFTLAESKYCSNYFSLTGSGSVSGSTLSINMSLTETGAGTYTCNFASLAKQ